MDTKICWFKRNERPDTEWERGEAFNFYNVALAGGGNSPRVMVIAKEDGATLSIGIKYVYLTDEHPDKIKERLDLIQAKLDKAEADKREKERLENHAKNERRIARMRAEEAQKRELEA